MKILIAEDDFASRNVLQFMLRPYGEVFIAIDGGEAIEAFSTSLEAGDPYKLIFMDIMMPDVDGLIATEKIRAMEKERGVSAKDEAKVIMATAMSDAKTVMHAYKNCGATDYMVKPYDLDDIEALLEKLGIHKKE